MEGVDVEKDEVPIVVPLERQSSICRKASLTPVSLLNVDLTCIVRPSCTASGLHSVRLVLSRQR